MKVQIEINPVVEGEFGGAWAVSILKGNDAASSLIEAQMPDVTYALEHVEEWIGMAMGQEFGGIDDFYR